MTTTVKHVAALCGSRAELTEQSRARISQVLGCFVEVCARDGITRPVEVTGPVAERFVWGPTAAGGSPSAALLHLRRSSVRMVMRTARARGLCDHDPTLDLWLPPRSSCSTRPAEDDEVALIRLSASDGEAGSTRLPVVIGLCESGLSTAEVAMVRIADLDDLLNPTAVHTPGTSRTTARWCVLTPWAGAAVARRVDRLTAGGPGLFLCGRGSSDAVSAQASVCVSVRTVVRAAGLAGEPGFRPHSLRAWRGQSIYRTTGDLGLVAAALGIESHDRAASIIGVRNKAVTTS